MVYYCPGSMSGSPAWLSLAEAEKQCANDTRLMEKLEKADALSAPACWPHIGGTCSRCKPKTIMAEEDKRVLNYIDAAATKARKKRQ